MEWSSTNKLYVVDLLNNRIGVIDLNLPTTDANFVTTLAGSTMGFRRDWITQVLVTKWRSLISQEQSYMLLTEETIVLEKLISQRKVTTLAGGHTGGGTCGSMSGLPFCNDGIGNQTEFFGPRGITARQVAVETLFCLWQTRTIIALEECILQQLQ